MALVHKYMADQGTSELFNNLEGRERESWDKTECSTVRKDGPEKLLVRCEIG
jgi:hypothetical protein